MKFLYSPDIWWLFPAYAYFSLYFLWRTSEHSIQARTTLSNLKSRLWNRSILRHLSAIENFLIDKKFESEAEIDELLSHALNKSRQKSLKLAVIGEFSSGKSTLINAMLGHEILRSSPLPTTTVSNSVVYSRKGYFEVKDKENRIVFRQEIKSIDEGISESIKKYTASEGNEGLRVTIGWKSPLLKSGIEIFDTPGVNSLTSSHRELACRTIEKEADYLLVLIKATQPLPMSLIKFIGKFRQDFLGRIVFVVTHIDQVKLKERRDLLDHIKNKIIDELSIAVPGIYDVSSTAELDFIQGSKNDDAKEHHLKFRSFIKDLNSQIGKERRSVINTGIELVLNNIRSIMVEELSIEASRLDKKIKALNNIDISEAPLYKDKTFKKYDHEIQKYKNELYNKQHSELVKKINELIDQSKDTIENAYFTEDITAAAIAISRKLAVISEQQIKDFRMLIETKIPINAISDQCEEELWKDYIKLKHFAYGPFHFILKIEELPRVYVSSSFSTTETTSSSNSSSGLAGAAAGAAIGSAIFPGIGTVIGGFFGMCLGSDAGSKTHTLDTPTLRKKIRSQTDALVRNTYDRTKSALDQMIMNQTDQLYVYISTRNSHLFSKYEDEVNKFNKEIDFERVGLEADRQALTDFIKKIKNNSSDKNIKVQDYDKKAA